MARVKVKVPRRGDVLVKLRALRKALGVAHLRLQDDHFIDDATQTAADEFAVLVVKAGLEVAP